MGRISLELVPRSIESLETELSFVTANFKGIDTINIPDLLRFDLRSWDACLLAKAYIKNTIPHIRAIDIDPSKPIPMADCFISHQIREVVIVTGDPPQDMSHRVYNTTVLEVIRMFKEQIPGIKVYAAISPYRKSMSEEYSYATQKIRAGADGFFTQPIFDLRLLGIYADLLQGFDVFWGIAPVVSERSKGYWAAKNGAVFPKNFIPDLEWNIRFAREAMELIDGTEGNVYLMPIKLDVSKYLESIFA